MQGVVLMTNGESVALVTSNVNVFKFSVISTLGSVIFVGVL